MNYKDNFRPDEIRGISEKDIKEYEKKYTEYIYKLFKEVGLIDE